MLLEAFQDNWKKNFSPGWTEKSQLLVAVSGGADSTVLVDLLHQSGIPFSVAHCNFRLRGEESERDETFVKSLAERYNKPLFLQRFDTEEFASQQKLSVQEAARKLRYDWFAEIVSRQPSTAGNTGNIIRWIATAHHANDNVETLLINFFRGTGISGLHGILSKQNNIIRPLLFAKREEIERHAKENHLQWVEDSSNASDKYTRNFFRHQVLPLVKEVFSNAEDNLLQNIQRFSEAGLLYQQAIGIHKKKLLEIKGNEVHIPVLKLQKAEPLDTLIWEIAKEYGFAAAQVTDIKKLLTAENGKYTASPSHRIIRNRAWLIIAPLQTGDAHHILIEKRDSKLEYENGELKLKNALRSFKDIQGAENHIAMLDAKRIRYPLLLRKWKTGDYFYPLGMKKKKKISRFFIDSKLSKTEKEKVWVLEMDKTIIWVIGYRIDERFKITDHTKEILRIETRP